MEILQNVALVLSMAIVAFLMLLATASLLRWVGTWKVKLPPRRLRTPDRTVHEEEHRLDQIELEMLVMVALRGPPCIPENVAGKVHFLDEDGGEVRLSGCFVTFTAVKVKEEDHV